MAKRSVFGNETPSLSTPLLPVTQRRIENRHWTLAWKLSPHSTCTTSCRTHESLSSPNWAICRTSRGLPLPARRAMPSRLILTYCFPLDCSLHSGRLTSSCYDDRKGGGFSIVPLGRLQQRLHRLGILGRYGRREHLTRRTCPTQLGRDC